ncbi:hypothetical protein MTR_8g466950 [Medicago truncatula]|uniref:Uncharacterized protein n=1 Tax=Medicago truncatula TaxID=3880 RepID=A0A072TR53_MEDTR|nr:hypothetical protein MTR_8g466950 [Medicago truncatula]
MDPKALWLVHGARAPLLQKRNKMAPHREEALVYEQLSILVSSLVNVGCRWR